MSKSIITSIYIKLACIGIKPHKISKHDSYYYKSPIGLGKRNDNKGQIRTIRISYHDNGLDRSTLRVLINNDTDIWKVIDYITDFYY